MYFTLGTAGKAVGKSKMSILRAIKDGRLSYVEKTDAGYKIDPAELFRVFPPVTDSVIGDDVSRDDALQGSIQGVTSFSALIFEERLKALQQRIEDKEKQLEELRTDRDRWQQQADYWRQQATGLLGYRHSVGWFRSLFTKKIATF
jgi:FtsZ-binding cell division protein ZapB